MANIMINDLVDSVDLDKQAMAGLTGGSGYKVKQKRYGCFHRGHHHHHHRHHWCKKHYRGHHHHHHKQHGHYGW